MFGNWQYGLRTILGQNSRGDAAVRTSTLVVFLLGMLGQGFSPCPHHADLERLGFGQPAAFAGCTHGGDPQGDGNSSHSESENQGAVCSCLDACDTQSRASLPPRQVHPRSTLATVLYVVDELDTDLLDARPNKFLVPLPQPPPYSS